MFRIDLIRITLSPNLSMLLLRYISIPPPLVLPTTTTKRRDEYIQKSISSTEKNQEFATGLCNLSWTGSSVQNTSHLQSREWKLLPTPKNQLISNNKGWCKIYTELVLCTVIPKGVNYQATMDGWGDCRILVAWHINVSGETLQRHAMAAKVCLSLHMHDCSMKEEDGKTACRR